MLTNLIFPIVQIFLNRFWRTRTCFKFQAKQVLVQRKLNCQILKTKILKNRVLSRGCLLYILQTCLHGPTCTVELRDILNRKPFSQDIFRNNRGKQNRERKFLLVLCHSYLMLKKEEKEKKEQNMDLHDAIRGGLPIQFLTPPDRA